ncbi:MAG: glycosyltransferase family 4 protein [Bdellovibrionales bacterium]|nr:glycosyltransferase family 4 protein [Bdellovibrionales bacterium]
MKVSQITSLVGKFRVFVKNYGLLAALRQTARKVSQDGLHRLKQVQVLDVYSFINAPTVGKPVLEGAVSKKSINWVIPHFLKGSGGHLNIFRFMYYLEGLGYECRVIVMDDRSGRAPEVLRSQVREWFFPVQAQVYVGIENAPPAFNTVATSWQTAYEVHRFNPTVEKYYFVQDFEPWFYAQGSEFAFAEETYNFGFTGITAGNWLAEKLRTEFGMKTYAVGFSCEHDVYTYRPRSRSVGQKKKRVFFYARPPTPRRAFELGLLTLKAVCEKMPDVEVVFAGWNLSNFKIPFKNKSLGVADIKDLPEIYNTCDAALVLSFSNLSLLPLELMACGVPVVSNSGPWVEWILNSKNSMLARPTPSHLADALVRVLTDEDLAASLREEGLKAASSSTWENEAKKMAAVFEI